MLRRLPRKPIITHFWPLVGNCLCFRFDCLCFGILRAPAAAETFIQGSDLYSRQLEDGRYICVHESLIDPQLATVSGLTILLHLVEKVRNSYQRVNSYPIIDGITMLSWIN